MNLLILEKWLLKSCPSNEQDDIQPEIATLGECERSVLCLAQEQWLEALKASPFYHFIQEKNGIPLGELVDEYASTAERQFHVLITGVSVVMLFVQCNWIGPTVLPGDLEPCVMAFSQCLSMCKDDGGLDRAKILRGHIVNGEEVFSKMEHPILLAIARSLLIERVRFRLKDCSTAPIWGARTCRIHQEMVQQPAADLKSVSTLLMNDAIEKFGSSDIGALVWLESGLVKLQYNAREGALSDFLKSQELSGLLVEMMGAKGKRMKFQSFTTPQMTIHAASVLPIHTTGYDANAVNIVSIDDDLELLERPVLEDAEWERTKLHYFDEYTLLCLSEGRRINNPDNETQSEEIMPYLWRIEDSPPSTLTSHLMCLILKCRMERKRKRTRIRATSQMEYLVNVLRPTHSTRTPPLPVPLHMSNPGDMLFGIFSTALPPLWRLMTELSAWYLDDMNPADALQLLTDVDSWEGILRCYVAMQKTVIAERMLRERLKGMPDDDPDAPALWCLLGDMASDESCYRRAWRISGERSAHAMRCLGRHHYEKDEMAKAADCFKKSLHISPLSPETWFSLGHVLMKLGKYSKSSICFGRVVQLEPQTGSAWANLGTIHLLLKQPRKALGALREAVKTDRDNWKMLQNMVLAAAGCGAWQEAVHAMQRLVDVLGLNGVEWNILKHAVHAVAMGDEERARRLEEENKNKEEEDVSYAYQPSFNGDMDSRVRLGTKLVPLIEKVLGLVQEELDKEGKKTKHPGPATLLDFLARVQCVIGDWNRVLTTRHTAISMFRGVMDKSNPTHFDNALALIEPLAQLTSTDNEIKLPTDMVDEWKKSLKAALVVLLDDWFGDESVTSSEGMQKGMLQIQQWLELCDGDPIDGAMAIE